MRRKRMLLMAFVMFICRFGTSTAGVPRLLVTLALAFFSPSSTGPWTRSLEDRLSFAGWKAGYEPTIHGHDLGCGWNLAALWFFWASYENKSISKGMLWISFFLRTSHVIPCQSYPHTMYIQRHLLDISVVPPPHRKYKRTTSWLKNLGGTYAANVFLRSGDLT